MEKDEKVLIRCVRVEALQRCLQMGFDEPEPAIGATRDLNEEIGAVGIYQLRCLFDSKADMFAERRKDRRNGFDVSIPINNRERIPVQ